MKNWFNNNKSNIIIVLILLLFFSIPLIKVWDFQYLFTSDPWYHMYFTKYLEPISFYWKDLFLSDWVLSSHYPTLMRSYLYEFHIITNVDYLIIFKYFGFLTRFLLILFFILLVKLFLKNNKYLYIWIIFLLSWYYFWYRSYITFTENFIILFHLIILYYSILFLKSNKWKYLLLSTFFTSISLYFHYPSAIIPFCIYFSTIVIFLFNSFNKKNIYLVIKNLILFFILSSNSLLWVIKEYIWQVKYNVWETSWYWALNRFIPPNLDTYQNYQSEIIILFAFFWFTVLLKKIKKYFYVFFPFFVLLLITFILSNWTRFYLNLPTDRMQSFFMIPVWVISVIWFIYIIKKFNYIQKILLFFLIFVLSLNNVINSNWWFKIWRWEIPTWEYLIENYNNKINYYFDNSVSFQEMQFPYHDSIIIKMENLKKWDWIITREENQSFELIYNNREIFIYLYDN